MSGTFQGRLAFAKITIDIDGGSLASQSGDFSPTVDLSPGFITLTLVAPIAPSQAVYLCSPISSVDACSLTFINITETTLVLSSSILEEEAWTSKAVSFDILILVKPTI